MADFPGPWKEGDEVPGAVELNKLLRWAKSLAGLAGGPSIGAVSGASGRALGRAGRRPFLGAMSGASSPYAFAEVDAAGATIPGGRTGQVIEVNGLAGLGGKVALIRPNALDYRTVFVRLGSSGPDCDGGATVYVQVQGCYGGFPGVSVTISQVGGVGYSDSGTTDGSGLATFTGVPPGTYTPSISGLPAKYVENPDYAGPTTFTVPCGGSKGTGYSRFSDICGEHGRIMPAPGFWCAGICPFEGQAQCTEPITTSAVLSFAGHDVDLSPLHEQEACEFCGGDTYAPGWYGKLTLELAGLPSFRPPIPRGGCPPIEATPYETASVTLLFFATPCILGISAPGCPENPIPFYGWPNRMVRNTGFESLCDLVRRPPALNYVGASVTLFGDCDPVLVSGQLGTLSFPMPDWIRPILGDGPVTFTISEA